MVSLFATAAALLRGLQPKDAGGREAKGLLQELGYEASVEASPDSEALHRARLLEAAAQFARFFELGAPEAPGLFCFGAEVDPASIDPIHRGSARLGVSGVGVSMQEAFQRCVGEGIEYLSHLQSGEDRLLASGAVSGRVRLSPDIVAQFAGGIAATLLFRWLYPDLPSHARDIVMPHSVDFPAR